MQKTDFDDKLKNLNKKLLQMHIFYKQINFFGQAKLEKLLWSPTTYEVANKLQGYSNVLKRNHTFLWVTESFFTHNLNISYYDTFCLKIYKTSKDFLYLLY